ncbi:MAG: ScyD/ScyE family protein [Anaerolineae bacterium]|nr:ScyD/ScyE family protein [Anaerolineae bacterium]
MRKSLPLVLLLIVLFAGIMPAAAQDTNVIADGLNNPRGLYYDASGALWIAEAGTGGDMSADTEMGPVRYGGTAQVLRVAPGTAGAVPVLGGFPSAQGFDDIIGVNSVYVDADSIWLTTGLGPVADPLVEALLQIDSETLRIGQIVDLHAYEAEHNPDEDFVVSNPHDIAVGGDGRLYIIDASGNSLLTWTPDGGLQLFQVWLDLPVPTAVDIGADGSIYVGFLSAFPFEQGSARIEKWSPDGELLQTYGGLTGVTDVLVGGDGTVYAVQLASGYGDLGWIANTGSVVIVSDSGVEPVAEGLNYPFRLAVSPDGGLAVTVNSAFSPAGSGQVLRLSGDMPTLSADALAPVETPEAPSETPEAPSETPEAPSETSEAAGG